MVVGSLLLTFGSLTPDIGPDALGLGLLLIGLGGGLWLASQWAARDEGDPPRGAQPRRAP